jgi:hypothetical protein
LGEKKNRYTRSRAEIRKRPVAWERSIYTKKNTNDKGTAGRGRPQNRIAGKK